jgi:hypothetical protein
MKLIDPADENRVDYQPFWGCTEYAESNCRGTRNIDSRTGLPVLTEEEEDRSMLEWIRTEYYPDPGAEI